MVTALSGSGPAYFFQFIEAMVKAGTQHGLDEETAQELAVECAFGSIALIKETGSAPSDLRRRVTSKGGTTHSALEVFREKKLDDIVESAVEAAIKRGETMSKEFDI